MTADESEDSGVVRSGTILADLDRLTGMLDALTPEAFERLLQERDALGAGPGPESEP